MSGDESGTRKPWWPMMLLIWTLIGCGALYLWWKLH
jgi:hypothetical protein